MPLAISESTSGTVNMDNQGAVESQTNSHPDPQVTQRAPRRSFTAAEKLRIIAEADACKEPGQLSALLRKEGIYSSTLSNFRKQNLAGKLSKDPSLVRQQKREKEAARQRDARKIARLESENHKLRVLLELQIKSRRVGSSFSRESGRIIDLISEASKITGVQPACNVVGISRACYYRYRKSDGSAQSTSRRR